MIKHEENTKERIVQELHSYGEVWANESYPKEYLEGYLAKYKAASEMTAEELLKKIMEKKG